MSASVTKGRGRSSIIASTLQVLVSGAVFFIVFRYLYDLLGIDQIGVWSLVLATTSLSRIGELGLSAGVVRYVAQALGQGDGGRAADIVQSVCLALAVMMGLLLLMFYPVGVAFVGRLVPPEHVSIALRILPYALISLWINVCASVFLGALDGCHRIDLRCYAQGSSHLVFLVLVFLLAPRLGLQGVALAQVWQAVGLAVLSWVLLGRQLPQLPLVPLRWRLPLLREMLAYGLSFQTISVMNLLFEPVAKALLSRYGGLAALGHFEMANKLLLQGRSIIVEAGRILVPSVAALGENETARARELFFVSYRLTYFVAVVFYGLLGAALTAICVLWLGRYDVEFVQFALLLNVAWFVNTLIGPAYFQNLGSGRLRSNVVCHAIMGIVASVGGWLLGREFGGMGVVVGTALGLASGSLYLLIDFLRRLGVVASRFLVPRGLALLTATAAGLAAAAYLQGVRDHALSHTLAAALVTALVLGGLAWMHPLRRALLHRGP